MNNIDIVKGDILRSRAQTLVNTVNCVGVMGKGIALAFKKRFPEMYQDYVQRCNAGQVKLGQPYLYKRTEEPWILNFPTKDHWRSVSKLSDVSEGLEYLKKHYRQWGITSIAVPPLGCGNGQLDWDVVGPTLYEKLSELDIPVELYAPHETPAEQLKLDFLRGKARVASRPSVKVDPAHVALASIVSRIAREKYHWPIGRIAFQKIAYFATVSGIATGLEFQKGSFGPFARELKPIIGKLVNNGLVVETKRKSMFVVTPGPTYAGARDRNLDDLKAWRKPIERVADLFLRFQRTADIEAAASVHFVASRLAESQDVVTEDDVFEEVKKWKEKRTPPIDDEQIVKSIRYLNMLDWIQVKATPAMTSRLDEDELMIA